MMLMWIYAADDTSTDMNNPMWKLRNVVVSKIVDAGTVGSDGGMQAIATMKTIMYNSIAHLYELVRYQRLETVGAGTKSASAYIPGDWVNMKELSELSEWVAPLIDNKSSLSVLGRSRIVESTLKNAFPSHTIWCSLALTTTCPPLFSFMTQRYGVMGYGYSRWWSEAMVTWVTYSRANHI